jgi:uncharacterized protein (TIGR03435 family)
LEFDAVSVKPSDPNSRNGTVVSLTRGGGLRVTNATLKDLIETAYDVRDFQILGGPTWVGVTKYDVTATPGTRPEGAAASGPGNNNLRLRVQAMLKDRFQLRLHRETRSVPIYSLVVARGGIKAGAMRATDSPHRGVNAGKGTILGEAASMADLTSKLSRLLDRPVMNSTDLEGHYDFKLEWTPDSGPSAPDGEPMATSLGPSLFTALQQQLGLRLEGTKGPVDVLVIDHLDKPSEN